MKLACVLFIAFGAVIAPAASKPFIEEISENFDLGETAKNVREMIKKTNGELRQVEDTALPLLRVTDQLKDVLYGEVVHRANEFIKEVDGRMKELEGNNQTKKECLNKYQPNVDKIRKDANVGVKKCGDDTMNYVYSTFDEVQGELEVIHQLLGNLLNIGVDCIQCDSSRYVKCLQKKFDEIKGKTEKVKTSIEETLKKREGVKNIVKEYSDCRDKVVSAARKEFESVVLNIGNCSKQGE